MSDHDQYASWWGGVVQRYPELGIKWGTDAPLNAQGNLSGEAWDDYRRQMIGKPLAKDEIQQPTATPTATPTAGAPMLGERVSYPSSFWDPSRWVGKWPEEGGFEEWLKTSQGISPRIGRGVISLVSRLMPGGLDAEKILGEEGEREKEAREEFKQMIFARPEDKPGGWTRSITGLDPSQWKGIAALGATEFAPEVGAMQATIRAVEPVQGVIASTRPFVEPEVKERYNVHRDEGLDVVSAYSAAYSDAVEAGEIPGWKQFIIEFLSDPIEWAVPGGLFKTPVVAGAKGATRIARKLTTDAAQEAATAARLAARGRKPLPWAEEAKEVPIEQVAREAVEEVPVAARVADEAPIVVGPAADVPPARPFTLIPDEQGQVVRFNDRDIVLVEMADGVQQPFYRSTGRNSRMPGRWFPFDGIMPTGPIKNWFIKDMFAEGIYGDRANPLYRYGGRPELKEIGDQLGQASIPKGREIADNVDVNKFLRKPTSIEELAKQAPTPARVAGKAVEEVPVAARAAPTPDEVTELGRLNRILTRDETALTDILTDVEYIARFPGTKPRSYSMRYPGRQPGSPGYRPPLVRTAADRAEDIVDAKDAVRAAKEEVASAKKAVDETTEYLNQNQARLLKQGKSGKEEIASLKEDIAGAKSNHTNAKNDLIEANVDLKQANRPTGYTAEEKAYIAAADKLDVEYPASLRASIQRTKGDIAALEAKAIPTAPAAQIVDVPVTPAARVAGEGPIIERGEGISSLPRTAYEARTGQQYPGPQPGVANRMRLAQGEDFARGKQALKNRMDLEYRVKKSLDPETRRVADEFLDMLPDHMVEDLGSSYLKRIAEGDVGGTAKTGLLTEVGRYEPDIALINIFKRLVSGKVAGSERVIVHEIAHHLEQFVPSAEARKLVSQFKKEMSDRGQSIIDEVTELRKNKAAEGRAVEARQRAERAWPLTPEQQIILPQEVKPLTGADQKLVRDSYRYTNFQEWFAEVITDKALRDILMEIPEKRNVIQKVLDAIKELATSVYRTLLRRGASRDEAEKVYKNLINNEFDPAKRRSLYEDIVEEAPAPPRGPVARVAGEAAERGPVPGEGLPVYLAAADEPIEGVRDIGVRTIRPTSAAKAFPRTDDLPRRDPTPPSRPVEGEGPISISDEILSQTSGHPLDEFIRTERSGLLSNRQSSLHKLIRSVNLGAPSENMRWWQARWKKELANELFGDTSARSLKRVDEFVEFSTARRELFKIESWDDLKKAVSQRSWQQRLRDLNKYYDYDTQQGKWLINEGRPLDPSVRGYKGRLAEGAVSRLMNAVSKTIPEPPENLTQDINYQDFVRRGGILSDWFRETDHSIVQVRLIDDMRIAIKEMGITDEIANGTWNRDTDSQHIIERAMQRYEGAVQRMEDYTSEIERVGTEDLIKSGLADEAGNFSEEMIGVSNTLPGWSRIKPELFPAGTLPDSPGRVDLIRRALHDADKWLEPLRELDRTLYDSPVLERHYWQAKYLTRFEEAFRVADDSFVTTVDDYFNRGWKLDPGAWDRLRAHEKNMSRGLGQKAPFKMARNDLPYEDMRSLGWTPYSHNIYKQAMFSARMGLRDRLGIQILDLLQDPTLELAKKVDIHGLEYSELVERGWGVVRNMGNGLKRDRFLGASHKFGKVVEETKGGTETVNKKTLVWMFPNPVAKTLDNMFGPPSHVENIMKAEIRLKDVPFVGRLLPNWAFKGDDLIFIPKRSKLFGTLFQQSDFGRRAFTGGFQGQTFRLLRGMELLGQRNIDEGFRELWLSVYDVRRIPQSWFKMARANVSPAYRAQLKREWTSTDSWFAPEQIKANPALAKFSWAGFREQGLHFYDYSLIPKDDIPDLMKEIVDEAWLSKGLKAPVKLISKAEKLMREGLFEGLYPSAIMHDVRHNIFPIFHGMHPDMAPEELMALVARETNLKWSTLPKSQSVMRGWVKDTATRTLFSINELETGVRSVTRVVTGGGLPGPRLSAATRKFWINHWISFFLSTALLGNLIHFMSTTRAKKDKNGRITGVDWGSALPFGRYMPWERLAGGTVKKPFSWLNYGYKSAFLAPDIPVPTRSGDLALLDLMIQQDTFFRMTDVRDGFPVWGFLNDRMGTLPRTILNQGFSSDYMGRDISEYGILQRTFQAAYDGFAPIGAGHFGLAMVRKAYKDKEFPKLFTYPLVPEGATVADVTPSVEARLGGWKPLGLQALGFNVKAVNNQELKNRMVVKTFGDGDYPGYEEISLNSWDKLRNHSRSDELAKVVFDDPVNAGEVKEMKERQEEGVREWYDDFAKYISKRAEVYAEYRGKEAALVEEMAGMLFNPGDNTAWDPTQFRTALRQLNFQRRAELDGLEQGFGTDPTTLAKIEEQKKEPDKGEKPVEWLKWRWRTLRAEPGIYNEVTNKTNYQKLNAEWAKITAGWEPDQLEAFESWLHMADHHPFVGQYYGALEVLSDKGYWRDRPAIEGPSDIFSQTMGYLVSMYPSIDALGEWGKYLDASPKEKARLRGITPLPGEDPTRAWGIRQVIKFMEDAKKRHRDQLLASNPDLDEIRVMWFGSRPVHYQNKDLFNRLYRQASVPR